MFVEYWRRVKPWLTLIAGFAVPAWATDTLSSDRVTLGAVTTLTARLAVLTVASRRTLWASSPTHTRHHHHHHHHPSQINTKFWYGRRSTSVNTEDSRQDETSDFTAHLKCCRSYFVLLCNVHIPVIFILYVALLIRGQLLVHLYALLSGHAAYA